MKDENLESHIWLYNHGNLDIVLYIYQGIWMMTQCFSRVSPVISSLGVPRYRRRPGEIAQQREVQEQDAADERVADGFFKAKDRGMECVTNKFLPHAALLMGLLSHSCKESCRVPVTLFKACHVRGIATSMEDAISRRSTDVVYCTRSAPELLVLVYRYHSPVEG